MVEDHYVMIVDLSHVTPLSGQGKIIAATIYKYLKEENLLDQPIYVIGTVMLEQRMEPSTSWR